MTQRKEPPNRYERHWKRLLFAVALSSYHLWILLISIQSVHWSHERKEKVCVSRLRNDSHEIQKRPGNGQSSKSDLLFPLSPPAAKREGTRKKTAQTLDLILGCIRNASFTAWTRAEAKEQQIITNARIDFGWREWEEGRETSMRSGKKKQIKRKTKKRIEWHVWHPFTSSSCLSFVILVGIQTFAVLWLSISNSRRVVRVTMGITSW